MKDRSIKRKIKMPKVLFFSLLLVILTACSSKEEIIYFQNNTGYSESNIEFNEQLIQPNDILKVEIGSMITEAAIPYNKPVLNTNPATSLELIQLNGYVVNKNSEIELPVLGKISVKSKTLEDLEKEIKQVLVEGKHLEQPTVTIRILNAKVTVLGEVKKPGTFYITEPRVTILQVLGLAGDLTINGKRKDVLLIRELGGKRKTIHIDLTDIDLLNKPFYQVKSNDVIVVQPNYAKVKSAGFIGNPGTLVSVASLIVSLTILFTN